jgi:hypothetical protein
MLTILIAGAGGGVVRGIVGYLKHQFAYKNVKFELNYFLLTLGLSAIAGVTITWAVTSYDLGIFGLKEASPAFAFIAGYAGGDLLENVYKTIVGKVSFFPSLPK